MRYQSARVLATPADAPSFRAYDLNQPQEPSAKVLVSATDWRSCEVEYLPEKDGPMVLGVDLSSGYAMSAAAAYWPATGRLEAISAFQTSRTCTSGGRMTEWAISMNRWPRGMS